MDVVAFTPTWQLPYQEGSDPPCFGPGTGCDNLTSTWCDFAEIVNGFLDDIDQVAARTTTAIPMAKVRYQVLGDDGLPANPPPQFTTGTIPFDTVVFDTDNMVDFNVTSGITPNRNGVYRIDMWIAADSSGDDFLNTAYIQIGSETEPFNGFSFQTVASGNSRCGASGGGSVRASVLWNFQDTTPTPRSVRVFIDSSFMLITDAKLQVTWHSEAV